MAIDPTRYSRVSVGWRSSTQSLADLDTADTGRDFSCINGASTGSFYVTGALGIGGAFTPAGAITGSSTLSINGAATFQSTVTTRGTLTAGTMLVQSAATFNSTLSADGAATFQSTLSTRGTATAGTLLVQSAATFVSTASVQGAATFQSTLSSRGQVNADAGIQVGGGVVAQIISSTTTDLAFGSIGVSGGISSVTVAFSGVSKNDVVLITPDANWFRTAANRGIAVYASSTSTVGEVDVWAVNSGLTAVTPTAATVFRLTRIKFGNYPAA